MFASHFAVAAAAKTKTPETPVWALMLSTQLLDILFIPLLLTGVETIEPVAEGYGGALINAAYTHSLVGSVVLALLAGVLAKRAWGHRSGVTIGALVFSHWLLDLLVHRPDLPILPGNLGNLPLLGLGLWQSPALSAGVEALLILAGSWVYFRSVLARGGETGKGRAVAAGSVMAVLLVLSLVSDVAGIGG